MKGRIDNESDKGERGKIESNTITNNKIIITNNACKKKKKPPNKSSEPCGYPPERALWRRNPPRC